jgi:DNA-binding PadR family transcriptional regulator
MRERHLTNEGRGRGRGFRGDEHFPGHGGHPGRPGRRGRMRRGDIRTALLAVLSEGPGHGYDVMQNLEEKSGGAWRPSPGSVYPTLQLLEDEGLVRSAERDGKRIFEITDAGREEATRRIEDAGGTPWELDGRNRAKSTELREAVMSFHMAFKQIAMVGTPAQLEQATEIVRDARRRLYQLLAD